VCQNFSIAAITQRFPNLIYSSHREKVIPISWDVKKQLFSISGPAPSVEHSRIPSAPRSLHGPIGSNSRKLVFSTKQEKFTTNTWCF